MQKYLCSCIQYYYIFIFSHCSTTHNEKLFFYGALLLSEIIDFHMLAMEMG